MMASSKRVYEVCDNATGKSRLILATSAAQVARHVLNSTHTVALPSQEECLRLSAQGVKLETAGAEVEPDAGATSTATT